MTSPAPSWSAGPPSYFSSGPNTPAATPDPTQPSPRPMTVKVLYSLDGQHNCLARGESAIEIQTILINPSSQIGLVDLSYCIRYVLKCSPELHPQLKHNDFAVYAHDYSEEDIPLVGYGMLSWIVFGQGQEPTPKITGRVLRNLVAHFTHGAPETLEVKLKLKPVPMQSMEEHTRNLESFQSREDFLEERRLIEEAFSSQPGTPSYFDVAAPADQAFFTDFFDSPSSNKRKFDFDGYTPIEDGPAKKRVELMQVERPRGSALTSCKAPLRELATTAASIRGYRPPLPGAVQDQTTHSDGPMRPPTPRPQRRPPLEPRRSSLAVSSLQFDIFEDTSSLPSSPTRKPDEAISQNNSSSVFPQPPDPVFQSSPPLPTFDIFEDVVGSSSPAAPLPALPETDIFSCDFMLEFVDGSDNPLFPGDNIEHLGSDLPIVDGLGFMADDSGYMTDPLQSHPSKPDERGRQQQVQPSSRSQSVDGDERLERLRRERLQRPWSAVTPGPAALPQGSAPDSVSQSKAKSSVLYRSDTAIISSPGPSQNVEIIDIETDEQSPPKRTRSVSPSKPRENPGTKPWEVGQTQPWLGSPKAPPTASPSKSMSPVLPLESVPESAQASPTLSVPHLAIAAPIPLTPTLPVPHPGITPPVIFSPTPTLTQQIQWPGSGQPSPTVSAPAMQFPEPVQRPVSAPVQAVAPAQNEQPKGPRYRPLAPISGNASSRPQDPSTPKQISVSPTKSTGIETPTPRANNRRKRSQTSKRPSTADGSTAPVEEAPTLSVSYARRKELDEQRRLLAVSQGQQPRYCQSCGAIEGPWRLLHTLRCSGKPLLEHAQLPSMRTFVHPLTGAPEYMLYSMQKKSGFTKHDLCNACGIHFKSHASLKVGDEYEMIVDWTREEIAMDCSAKLHDLRRRGSGVPQQLATDAADVTEVPGTGQEEGGLTDEQVDALFAELEDQENIAPGVDREGKTSR